MIKLNQILYKEDLEVYILDKYNSLGQLIKFPLTEEFASAIAVIITEKMSVFENCDTIFDDVEEGKAAIHNYLRATNIYALVNEVRNLIKSLSTDTGKLHRQSKFNPIDNDNIEQAPVEVDDTEFTIGQNWLDNIDFIINNSKKIRKFANYVINACYITPVVLGEE